MKQLIIAVLTAFVFAFTTNTVVAQQNCSSLANTTGEQVSLWDALAAHLNVNPTSWTVAEFRAQAAIYATSVGLTYDKSGKGNVAIVHALLCERTTTYTDDFPEYTVFYHAVERAEGRIVLSQDTMWHKPRVYPTSVIPFMQPDTVATLDTVTFQNNTEATHHVVMLGDSVIGSWTSAPVGVQGSSDTVRIIDTVTIASVVTDTVVENWCDCSPERTLAELWEDYMVNIPNRIASETDKGQRALLKGCREKIGRIVRTEHRYGGRLIEDDVNMRDQEASTNEPGMRIGRVKLDVVDSHSEKAESKGGQKGIGKAMWQRFVHNWKKFWRSIGACRRAGK